DGKNRYPLIRYALELRPIHRKNSANPLFADLRHPIGAASLDHRHRVKRPTHRMAVEGLRLLHVVSHQLVPAERTVRHARSRSWYGRSVRPCGVSVAPPLASAELAFELVERLAPAGLVAVARGLVEELLVDQGQQRAVAVRLEQHGDERFALRCAPP